MLEFLKQLSDDHVVKEINAWLYVILFDLWLFAFV